MIKLVIPKLGVRILISLSLLLLTKQWSIGDFVKIANRVRPCFIYLFLAFSALSIHSFAQTGPGGIGNSSGEFSQPANIIWLDPNSLLYSDGAPILEWKDIS
ncbi:MAG TPA: hypothetical protein VFE57_04795, partial [Cyclobacteriaceae bacterium]|nr:hypothetical protein [Cyclobacteriaceae bacterium]